VRDRISHHVRERIGKLVEKLPIQLGIQPSSSTATSFASCCAASRTGRRIRSNVSFTGTIRRDITRSCTSETSRSTEFESLHVLPFRPAPVLRTVSNEPERNRELADLFEQAIEPVRVDLDCGGSSLSPSSHRGRGFVAVFAAAVGVAATVASAASSRPCLRLRQALRRRLPRWLAPPRSRCSRC